MPELPEVETIRRQLSEKIIGKKLDNSGYSRQHKVYQRTGQKCVKCGSVIERIKMAGRSAHYCSNCQK